MDLAQYKKTNILFIITGCDHAAGHLLRPARLR